MISTSPQTTILTQIWQELSRGFYVFSLTFLLMTLLWNIMPKLPRLPGDIHFNKEYAQFYIPLPSSIIIAALLTMLGNYLHL
ncbi:DUF2905 domain-containing protein [Patescibacteria group bacterium]|nr:DUF2905 domain-containing protein [Patescibacteria group bacterium]MCL5410135.1 DUF2905 domain-containing protein [Patescibacteria group bacterium]